MLTQLQRPIAIFWALSFVPTLSAMSPPLSIDEMRVAVARSIPPLEVGAKGSADQRECFTCHSQGLPVLALSQAKRQGFEIDESNLQRQLQHTYDHLQRGVENYRKAKGQGGGVLTAGYALWTLEAGGWDADATTVAVAHFLLENQVERGHWQHRGSRPPSSGSDFTATYVALRGLASFAGPDQRQRLADRQARVTPWLLEHAPVDTEDAVFRLKSLAYIEARASAIQEATTELVQQQRDDGGWGQNPEMESDAYATGSVLESIVHQGGLQLDHPSVRKGVAYLLKTQGDDGTWQVTTRAKPFQEYFESGFPYGPDQFISIAATAWSALALLAALPEASSSDPSAKKSNATAVDDRSNKPRDERRRQNANSSTETSYDIVLKGGQVVDGTGGPWYYADVGIRDGKIAKIGRLDPPPSAKIIDASKMIVAPGFIDMMGQTASPMVDDPKSAMNLLTQGITTINAGEGGSAAPLSLADGERKGWTTMAEYFALLEIQGLPVNVVQSVGHTQVRRLVLGEVDRRPGPEELERMQGLVREAMEAGAIGVSTALIYPPAVFAPTEEIAALAKVAGEYGGRYYTHMRNEGDRLLEAIDEALDIGRAGKTPVHIFHLKTAGQQNWGKMPLAIAKIRAARAVGEQVTADIYPYINNGLEIGAFIHPRHFSDGREALIRRLQDIPLRQEIRHEMETTDGWENWFRHVNQDWDRVVIGQTRAQRYRQQVGQSVAKIAAANSEDPWDTFFHLVASGAFALPQSMTEANKILAMQQDFISFCTDVGPAGGNHSTSHPRAYGAFPRLFSRYVRELGAISLERAVAQASAVAANEVFAYDRGKIAEGLAADIVVFDYQNLSDQATFANPSAPSIGVKHVIVNGVLVLDDGRYTEKRPGRVLRGPGYRLEHAPAWVSSGEPVESFQETERMLRNFMSEHRIPGAAIAVTDQSRIVYARGFGYADVAAKQSVQPTSLFRIASISKPITAVAILQLVEQGKLKLDAPVLSVLDLETEIREAGASFEPRWREITIEHLLQHRGGWDRDQSFDAMFRSVGFAEQSGVAAPAGTREIIVAMLRQKLDFDPGARFAYSNFGYCLLGRVIERLTDLPYEKHVQERVLKPLGISTMQLGATRLSGRAANEVRYYQPGTTKSVFQIDLGQEVPWPYGGWNLEAMDAHGGWLASAEDLARFAIAFDDPDHCPILTRSSIERMHARPPGLAGYDEQGEAKDVYYSLGWQNRVVGDRRLNHWHTGSLAGTATILIRRHDGRNFVALFNSRVSPSSTHLGQAFDRLLGSAIPVVDEAASH